MKVEDCDEFSMERHESKSKKVERAESGGWWITAWGGEKTGTGWSVVQKWRSEGKRGKGESQCLHGFPLVTIWGGHV